MAGVEADFQLAAAGIDRLSAPVFRTAMHCSTKAAGMARS